MHVAPHAEAMRYVLLLRAPEEDGPDRYEVAFEGRGYVPLTVPVLETVLVHVEVLRAKIIRGADTEGLSGVILTSKRAVEAWCEALRSIAEMSQVSTDSDWRMVPFYVVGDATAKAVSQIRVAFPAMKRLAPMDVRGGPDMGTAERLAAFILEEGSGDEGRRMLYLTGDKNRETLPGKLTAGGVALETLEVYRTTGSSTFRADLGAALEKALVPGPDRTRPGEWGWVVYFAPSAAAFVTPVLQEVFCLDANSEDDRTLKVAVIGPTTAAFLRETLKMRVDVVSPKPTPDALCSAVVAFDSSHMNIT